VSAENRKYLNFNRCKSTRFLQILKPSGDATRRYALNHSKLASKKVHEKVHVLTQINTKKRALSPVKPLKIGTPSDS
jgi:hypothetical protein